MLLEQQQQEVEMATAGGNGPEKKCCRKIEALGKRARVWLMLEAHGIFKKNEFVTSARASSWWNSGWVFVYLRPPSFSSS